MFNDKRIAVALESIAKNFEEMRAEQKIMMSNMTKQQDPKEIMNMVQEMLKGGMGTKKEIKP